MRVHTQVLRPRRAGVAEETLRLEVKLLNGADLLLELVRGAPACLSPHCLTHPLQQVPSALEP